MAQTVLGWLAGWLAGVTFAASSTLGTACTDPPPSERPAEIAISGERGADASASGPAQAQPPAPDPYNLAGKTTRQLDELLASVKPSGTTYYDLSPEDRAYFDALATARARRLGKPPGSERQPDIDKSFPGAYANPGKDPNSRPPVEPSQPVVDGDAGAQP